MPLKLCFRTALRSSVSWTSYKDQLQPECSSHTLSQVLHLYQKKFSYDLNRFNQPYKMGLLFNGLWTKSSLRNELRVRVSVVLTFLSENYVSLFHQVNNAVLLLMIVSITKAHTRHLPVFSVCLSGARKMWWISISDIALF